MSELAERIANFKAAIDAMPYVKEAVSADRKFNSYEAACTGDDDNCPDDEREYFFAIGPITNFNALTYLYGKQKAELFEAAFKLAHAIAFEKELAG